MDKAKAELDEVSTRVLEEVERFKREKLADFKDVLLDYVQLQIDYNSRVRPQRDWGLRCCALPRPPLTLSLRRVCRLLSAAGADVERADAATRGSTTA